MVTSISEGAATMTEDQVRIVNELVMVVLVGCFIFL